MLRFQIRVQDLCSLRCILKRDFNEHMLSSEFRFGGAGSEFDQKQLFEHSRAHNCQWTMTFTTFRLTVVQEHFQATTGIYYLKGSYLVYVSQSQSYFTTDGLPPITSWRQAPRDPRPIFLFSSWTLELIVLCNILSHERMGLSFKITAGPCQCSHSQVRVPRESWPHFTVSGSRPAFTPVKT
jgi:hypothetical protein